MKNLTEKEIREKAREITTLSLFEDFINEGYFTSGENKWEEDYHWDMISEVIKNNGWEDLTGEGDQRICKDELNVLYHIEGGVQIKSFENSSEYEECVKRGFFDF